MLKLSSIFFAALLLTGCAAGLGEDYSCTKVGGVSGCTSMDEVRRNIDLYTAQENPTSAEQAHRAPTDFMTLPRRTRQGEPTRTEDVVKKVSVFPFIDKNGHYVDTTDIYIILDDSRWTGRPVRAIWKD
ncbi:type IV conjugative transfer system lipoprotein TraV [Vibrio parahaemolyticus]|uniref:type IV conjugative transfer system lipoprotein TraV n=1 Tax=Vibrio parahaemolyticus TaxID=670 RepID=UPI001B8361B8|nr:type IV conjugative transfer system lipoprotein TraV [Vibrio parahaemolyticus]UJW96482.1 type IV conjugative transfer system lipoprotein TraV [Vibrio parahaemolyticus]HBB9944301.1 type IV conjugative transfer system lipoprotein TraV [Vibrio parahaemolyticus]HBC3416772.1 type IV conjugative transfer system lipoprotein TraV [Vibrio parahaemolyticus]HBC3602254.1 type IV conjugative transfer system lipoprotein TraV [Vibrio parahaemolyticus]HBC3878324.1 type IV conjugative transfer system lipopr